LQVDAAFLTGGALITCPTGTSLFFLLCLLRTAGTRHSVGGSDYGGVRVGTFMGLRIISQVAHEAPGGSSSSGGNGEVAPIGAPSLRFKPGRGYST
jgi:hypothetical protein